jgi:phosphoribosylformimino-5-aminoimidazole carboxamide ribonucleotide (ProFAR) isomerase
VTFEVLPAIDLAGGRLVRMTGEGAVPVDAFDGDPLAAARAFVDAGATRLHVVDVGLAATGEPRNLGTIASIVAVGVPVQASGGVRTPEHVAALLDAGADRVVIGSGALADRGAVAAMLGANRERVALGIEADGPTIRPRGLGEELPMWETLQWLSTLEVPRFVFTEVGRVASLGGPDLDGVWALATHTGRPVLASGGVRSIEDLRALAALDAPVEGAIVGRALYEGLDLREALSVG